MKQFFGYNSREEAEIYFKDIINSNPIREKEIDVSDDGTKFPQTFHKSKTYRIETDKYIIAW